MKRLGNKNGQVFFHAKGLFFSTPAVSVLKILTGPSDTSNYSVPDFVFVYVLLLNKKYFVSCVYAFIENYMW